jgi:nitrogen regulation protein NR(I)
MAQPKVLVVDDEANIRLVLCEVLRREGLAPEQCANGAEALDRVKASPFDIVIMDVRMPRMDGITALKEMMRVRPETAVLIITAHGSENTAMEAMEAGAYDYFSKPFDINEVRVVVRRAAERIRLLKSLKAAREEAVSRYSFDRIVGQSSGMREVFDNLKRVVETDVSVLVTGESGTGKELVAAALHHNSLRRDGPFIKVNTVAIPETLLESEMFGHERGSFTGAVQQKIGKVEAANGGTLFLDEIGDMPLALQAKLLRVLQEREITRVGSTKSIKVDIRVVCATNRDLLKCVEQGTFREDLYYRINVLPVHIPPLRHRREDIPLLLDHFIQVYNPKLGKAIKAVSPEVLDKFLNYPWPGNVRELENIVQRTMLMTTGDTVEVDDLPPVLKAVREYVSPKSGVTMMLSDDNPLKDLDLGRLLDRDDFSIPLADRLTQISDHIEKYLIKAALEKKDGHRQETADLLGISRKSLHNKMVRYELFDEGRPTSAGED